jgi:hypothetical protein
MPMLTFPGPFLRTRDLGAESTSNLLNEREIFAERASCITDPEATEGPYCKALNTTA